MKNSSTSLQGAFYELSYLPLCQEFKKAHQRGVLVNLVLEKDQSDNTCTRLLSQAGISIVTDEDRPALMHNKFLIIDALSVWTGSTNLTSSGLFSNRNNVLLLTDATLAAAYQQEFQEMFTLHSFGKKSPRNTALVFQVGPTPLSVIFSPEKNVSKILAGLLSHAQSSIKVCAFVFTDPFLIKVLEKKKQDGLKIKIILDKSQAKSSFSIAKKSPFLKENIYIYKGKGKLHHKFMTLDNKILITGSYNFSQNAAKNNDENILMLRNSEISRLYEEEYKRILKNTGRP